MGLLRFEKFSSIPDLQSKIRSRREQKEKFVANFVEWGLLNGTQVIQSATSASTLFTVPEGRVLYITEAFIGGGADGNNTGSAALQVDGITFLSVSIGINGTDNPVLNFRKPIKVESGGIIALVDTGVVGLEELSAGFNGFEIAKSKEIV